MLILLAINLYLSYWRHDDSVDQTINTHMLMHALLQECVLLLVAKQASEPHKTAHDGAVCRPMTGTIVSFLAWPRLRSGCNAQTGWLITSSQPAHFCAVTTRWPRCTLEILTLRLGSLQAVCSTLQTFVVQRMEVVQEAGTDHYGLSVAESCDKCSCDVPVQP
jgi:hypothetical protein